MADLRVVLGPLAALEEAFSDAMTRTRAGDPLAPVTVLVGQTLLKRYLPRMLAQRGAAHINVRFVLADELAASLAGPARPRAAFGVEQLLVRQAARAGHGAFEASAQGDGFVGALKRLVREFERGGIAPGELGGVLAAAGVERVRAEAIAAMYTDFDARRRDAGFESPSAAHAGADPARLKGPLLVYGLWDPPATVSRLLLGLAAGRDCTVFLPETGLDADDAHAAFRRLLESAGATTVRAGPAPPDVGAVLAARVLRAADDAPPGADGVSLVSAPDTVREVWEAARACMTWAGEGIAFHEIAVAYRHRDPYRGLIDEIFRLAGIPAYIHDGRPLAQHPLGRRLLLLIDLLGDASFSRRHVMQFVTETRIPAATRALYRSLRTAEWDGFTREAGIVEGLEQWQLRLQRLAGEKRAKSETREDLAWLAGQAGRVEELLAFIEQLHARLAPRPAVATWEDHLRFVREAAAHYADGLAPLLDVLRDLVALAAVEEMISFETFAAAVRHDLEMRDVSHVLGAPPREFGRQGVAVVDVSSLRHMRFRAVYMVGAAERAWPPPARPDPFLLEHERRAVNAAAPAGAWLPLRTEPDQETLTFLMALSAARERIAISYARSDAGSTGRHLPSHFFRAVVEALEGRPLAIAAVEHAACVRRRPAGQLEADTLAGSLTRAEYDRGVISASLAAGGGDGVAALALADEGRMLRPQRVFARALEARRARWSGALTPYDGAMLSAAALTRAAAMGFGTRPVSASRLERYAECPYRFFLQYGLRIEDIEEPEALDRIDPRERGTLVHAVLERFLRTIGRDDPPSVAARDRHLVLLLQVAEEEAAACEARGITGRPLLWAIDRRVVLDDLVRWYDDEVRYGADDGLVPGAFEVRFGPGNGDAADALSMDEPLRLRVEGEDLLLQGRIDRIDYNDGATAFRVIDYKTGKWPQKAGFAAGKALQLAIYMQAAARALGVPYERGEAQYYYCTQAAGFARRTLTGPELAARTADLHQILATVRGGVEGGTFPANPGNGGANCHFCDYQLVCDSRKEALSARKAADPRLAAFVAMQDID